QSAHKLRKAEEGRTWPKSKGDDESELGENSACKQSFPSASLCWMRISPAASSSVGSQAGV
ncbi:MAG: hypothetical protein AAF394_18875, partial [Planctomycetota bacterium]